MQREMRHTARIVTSVINYISIDLRKKEEYKMNVMILSNSTYLKHTYTMLYSLFVNHPDEPMDIYMPYEDMTEMELADLSSYVESFMGKRLHPLYVGDEFKQKVTVRNGLGVETYYRILGIHLLPEDIDRILYLDSDMIIKGSLKSLYETDITDAAFAVCEDIFGIINGFHEANKYRMNIPKEYSYFNAGVMLYNLEYLRKVNAAEAMLNRIYENYEHYEYCDQDVMNEMFYDRLVYVGWDEYNCPPIWCYINKNKLADGVLEFADYNQIREFSETPEILHEKYQNITRQIYENAKIIHYLGDTKPWSKTREDGRLYQIFDEAYSQYAGRMKAKGIMLSEGKLV